MKKQLLGLMTILTVFGACQKNEISVSLPEEVTIHATIEDKDATKTVMDESNNILWSENDQIVAFMKSSYGYKYQVKPSFVGKSYADFTMVSSNNGSDLSAGNEWEHNVVYYPYSEDIECLKSGANYALEVNLPTEQVYVPDSFANGSMAMVAVSENNNITFNNVLGAIKLQLKGTQTVKSIKIEGKNNEKLSGAATVTAYTDETKPAIVMESDASTSVTLNCGAGVQLNESNTTEFIIALPPVLFSQGFIVNVTDTDDNTYIVESDVANNVLRSSILVMPAFKLGNAPDQGSDDILVTTVFLDKSSMVLAPGAFYTLKSEVEPYNALNQTLSWTSSSSSVVSVDQNGKIHALANGTAVISAVAVGGASASCTVQVISCTEVPLIDYIDEYGVNHGKGISIGNTVWAPVNCGFKAANDTNKGYPYGKLYQWGRKYGQGYDGDETYPSGENIVEGPVMPSVAQAEENSYKYYYNPSSPYDWNEVQNDNMWNSGTESSPIKTDFDPCPEGWRVPTYKELDKMNKNHSSWTTENGQKGYYFSGDYTYIDKAPQIFFPAAGCRTARGVEGRDSRGVYWSSKSRAQYSANDFHFTSGAAGIHYGYATSYGFSVRCVQE